MLTSENGIIKQAEEAKNKTEQAANDEKDKLNKIEENMYYYTLEDLKGTISPGSYVEYVPNNNTYNPGTEYSNKELSTDTTLLWKYLGRDSNGNVLLISDKNTTENKITLPAGENSYNNLVDVIDGTCSALYSSDYGTARNLKFEDIELNVVDRYFEEQIWEDAAVPYGEKFSVQGTHTYPKVFKRENEGTLGRSEKIGEVVNGIETSSEGLTVRQSVYGGDISNGFKDKKVGETILCQTGTFYWLSSRGISTFNQSGEENKRVDFYDIVAIDNAIGGYTLYTSLPTTDVVYGATCEIRPVIVLNEKISIVEGKQGKDTSGTIENPYRLRL